MELGSMIEENKNLDKTVTWKSMVYISDRFWEAEIPPEFASLINFYIVPIDEFGKHDATKILNRYSKKLARLYKASRNEFGEEIGEKVFQNTISKISIACQKSWQL